MIVAPILLALAAQGPTLDADNAKAGLICADAWVTVANAEKQSPFLVSSGVGHYRMQSAAADQRGMTFLDRVSQIGRETQPKPIPLADAQALMPQCDKRFPMARVRTAATLPAIQLDSDMLCFAASSIQLGAAMRVRLELNDDSEVKHWEPIETFYTKRLEQAGLTDGAEIDRAFNRIMLASLQIGNVDTISRACEAQFTKS